IRSPSAFSAARIVASQSPRLLPRAMATRIGVPGSAASVADPAARTDDSPLAGADVCPAEQVADAGGRLCERPLLFLHLAKQQSQHGLIAGVGERFDPRAPLLEEAGGRARICAEKRAPRVLGPIDRQRG